MGALVGIGLGLAVANIISGVRTIKNTNNNIMYIV